MPLLRKKNYKVNALRPHEPTRRMGSFNALTKMRGKICYYKICFGPLFSFSRNGKI